MGIRQNIFISIIIHTMVISSVFIIGGRVRDRTCPVPTDYMVVSLFKENITPESSSAPPWKMGAEEDLKDVKGGLSGGTTAKTELTADVIKVTGTVQAQELSISQGIQVPIIYPTGISGIIMPGQGTDFSIAKSQQEDKILEKFEGVPYTGGTTPPYNIIRAAIEEAKDYPLLARKKRIEGTVITGFTINNKGYPEDIRLEKGSGSEILDSAAIKIVKRAAPFPRVNGKIVVPITFKLTDSTSPH
jgi:TonB family protein